METEPPTIVTSLHSTSCGPTVIVPPKDGLWLVLVQGLCPSAANAAGNAGESKPFIAFVTSKETSKIPTSKGKNLDNRAAFRISRNSLSRLFGHDLLRLCLMWI